MSSRPMLALAALLSLSCCRSPAASPVSPLARPVVAPAAAASESNVVVSREASPGDIATGTAPALPDAAPMSPGCFAWSPSHHVAACLVGHSGSNLNEETEWRVAFSGEAVQPAFSLVPVTDAGWFEEPHRVVTPPEVRARLRARLAADGFIDLAPLRRIVPADGIEWAPGASVRWLHRCTFAGGDNAAERGSDSIEVNWPAAGPRVTLAAWDDQPVADPEIRAYVIPGGRYLVLDAVGRYADEGSYGVRSLTWLCDRETRRCQ